MKRINILIIFFSLIAKIAAQNISVSSFKLLDTDLTANTAGTMETDQNGETAALIKVVTTQTGFTFDGGIMGIVKTKQTPGEVWVYIPKGSKKISIKHPQLGVLRDYFFPIAIEAARTYEMFLTTGEVQTIVKQARTSQYVVFQLTPSNAVVELDGELLETTDGTATKMMKFGSYGYRIQAPNYISEAGVVTIDDPDNKKIVSIHLKQNFSKVTIKVENNAEIWVNGDKKGNGSWTGNLGKGIYEFEAKMQGHRSTIITKDIIVTQEPQTIILQAPTPIFGETTINSSPAMADIYLDDKRVGETPLVLSKVLIGDHTIHIRKTGYAEIKSSIIVKENENTDYNFNLKKSSVPETTISNNKDTIIIGAKQLTDTRKKTHDGGHYYGDLKSGKPNGYGRAVYNNGNIYEGEYSNGKRQGYGAYRFYDGEIYIGDWANDQFHGKGVFYFSNNNRYDGLWFRDYQHGHGVMYYFNGDKYDGDWKMDKRSGKGTYTFANGAYYKGDWRDDQKNGNGFYDWGDGSSYDGQWQNNVRSGKGTFRYADGDQYIGQWANDVQHGRGIYKFQNGDVYEGDYVDGERTGSGIFKYANGDKYTGQFREGDKCGKGTFVWKNGDQYVGMWSADKPNGKGKLTKMSGDVFEGQFKDGIFISE